MKKSLIVTILNEEKNIASLLESVVQQKERPDEVIIVDGGSKDNTWKILKEYEEKYSFIKPLRRRGNRSVGRNAAIEVARGDIILITDAGCVLDREWVKEITQPFSQKDVDIVAGYYKGTYSTPFQKALIPYVLVMPDKVDPETFLPATRSMAMRKKVWEDLGGFDEKYSHNEDYVFARKAKKLNKKIVFAENAITMWYPRTNAKEAFYMFYRFAYGDAEAGVIRPKVVLLFIRYIMAFILSVSTIVLRSEFLFYTLAILLLVYIIWAIMKNYSYVKIWQGLVLLPFIQFIADFAILKGTMKGLTKSGI